MKLWSWLPLTRMLLAERALQNALLVTSAACVVVLVAFSQSNPPKYQDGMIVSVSQHADTSNNEAAGVRYDVSIKVGHMVYVVLYTPPNGIDTVKYKTGMNLLVMIEKDTMTFHDLMGRKIKVPILHRNSVPAQASK